MILEMRTRIRSHRRTLHHHLLRLSERRAKVSTVSADEVQAMPMAKSTRQIFPQAGYKALPQALGAGSEAAMPLARWAAPSPTTPKPLKPPSSPKPPPPPSTTSSNTPSPIPSRSAKNESALVPILQTKLPVERVTLWSPSETSPPCAPSGITNASNLTLDRGSFSIVEKRQLRRRRPPRPHPPRRKNACSPTPQTRPSASPPARTPPTAASPRSPSPKAP